MEMLKQSINHFALKIPFFENYEVIKKPFGVKNLKNGKILKPIKSKDNDKYRLCRNGEYCFISKWDILCLVFLSTTNGKIESMPHLKKYCA